MPGLAFIDAVPRLRATEFESVDLAVAKAGEGQCARPGLTHREGGFFGAAVVVASGPFPVGAADGVRYCGACSADGEATTVLKSVLLHTLHTVYVMGM